MNDKFRMIVINDYNDRIIDEFEITHGQLPSIGDILGDIGSNYKVISIERFYRPEYHVHVHVHIN